MDKLAPVQLDMLGGIKVPKIHATFMANVELFDHECEATRSGHPYRYDFGVVYKPVPGGYTGGGGGPAESAEDGLNELEHSFQHILSKLPRARSDKETKQIWAEAKRFGAPLERRDRPVYYTIMLNAVEIVTKQLYQPGERILPLCL